MYATQQPVGKCKNATILANVKSKNKIRLGNRGRRQEKKSEHQIKMSQQVTA